MTEAVGDLCGTRASASLKTFSEEIGTVPQESYKSYSQYIAIAFDF